MLAALWRRFWSMPVLVLCAMALTFGANGVAARLAINEISPHVLVLVRWAIVCAALYPLLDRADRRELGRLARAHWFVLGWMGLVGFTGFNVLFYVAAHRTSAVNLTLLQSSIPPLVLLGTYAAFRTPVGVSQVAGMVVTFGGVLLVAAHGDLRRLSAFRFNQGDVYVLVACVFYALYTLGLRVRPAGTPLVFFAGTAFAALLWAIPFAGEEVLAGAAFAPSVKGWLVALFAALGPSLAGQLCYMRGVDLIGPGRAGLFANLIPIFGALCAVIVLHEAFTLADGIALTLGLGGISLAEWPKYRSAAISRRNQDAAAAGDPGLP